ncbi:MAG: hypothetical protein NZ959_09955, partial [Armatimonadetes bacterium]|nr:hypothetical protein [Armatimonadota bacterium]
TFGAGYDLPVGPNLLWQSNASFFYTRWSGATITNWVFMSAFAYLPAPWARLEASIGYAPRGFPVAGHPLTGISSFLLHRPGGLVRQFTRSPGGFLTLRLVIGTTF